MVLGVEKTEEFKKPKDIQIRPILLKARHKYTLTIRPDRSLDVYIFLVDSHYTIIDTDIGEPEDYPIEDYAGVGREVEVEVEPDKTGMYFLVIINREGKGYAVVSLDDALDIV